MNSKNIAWIQGAWQGSSEATHKWYHSQAQKLKGQNLDLLVLPELFLTPYFCIEENPANFDWAIPSDHPQIQAWQQLAQELSCVIVFPFFEKRAPGIYQNSAYVFERDGSIAGLYRKNHIPDDPGFYEKYYFTPGDTPLRPIATSAGILGVLICWDQWFPEAARAMCLQGADLLIYPTAIGWDQGEPAELYPKQLDAWKTSMRAHSIANGVFTLAVNRTGQEDYLNFWGHSFLCHPDGSLITEQDHEQNGLFQATICEDDIDLQRRAWPFFRDRRTDHYGILLQKWGTP